MSKKPKSTLDLEAETDSMAVNSTIEPDRTDANLAADANVAVDRSYENNDLDIEVTGSANKPTTEDVEATISVGLTNTAELSVEFIPTVHIFNGRLGGSGKSTAARLLCERYLKLGQSYTLIDADSNYNVARAYQKETIAIWEKTPSKIWGDGNNDRIKANSENFLGKPNRLQPANIKPLSQKNNSNQSNLLAEQIIFSNDSKLAYLGDRFLEIIDRYQTDIIVSLPANDGLEYWLDTNGIDLLMAAEAPPFKIVNWWVSFGSVTSQQMLVDFITKYPHLQHVFIRNLGITSTVPNWDRFSPLPDLTAMYEQGQVKGASILPWLSDPAILEAVDAGTPLHEILANGLERKPLNPIVKTKIEKWLEHNWRSFEQTGLLL
jgi:hypothetical protein